MIRRKSIRIRLWVWLPSGLGSGLGFRPGLCISNRAMVTERVRAMVRAGVRFTPFLRLGVGGWGRDRSRVRVRAMVRGDRDRFKG